MKALALGVLAACGRPAITSCDDDLGGIYVNGAERWSLTDREKTLEAYPLFPDVPAAGEYEVAPRVIDFDRTSAGITGLVKRRYMRGAKGCVAKVPARVTSCTGDGIEIVLADPVPPLAVEPCRFARPDSSRRERWTRE